MGFLENLFDPSKKEVKKLQKAADQIVALEDEYKVLSDEALKHKTVEFKERLAQGETFGGSLCDGAGSGRPHGEYAPLPGAAHRGHGAASRGHRRNENR